MNEFFSKYADVVLKSALKIKDDDVLAINTEEANVGFARILALKAKEITGNGSYLMVLDHGRQTEATEIFSDYVMQKSPTLFIYLQDTGMYDGFKGTTETPSAAELQRFRHLASPLLLGVPEIPFATVPMPSSLWSSALDPDEDGPRLSSVVVSDMLQLDGPSPEKTNDELLELNRYDLRNLNRDEGKRHARLYSYDGMTDISFDFVRNSRFVSNLSRTSSGREFCPSLFSSSYYRAIDRNSAEGRLTTTRPFLLFGRTVNHLVLYFENGRITDFEAEEEDAGLFSFFLSIEKENANIAEISIAEEGNPASAIPFFAYPEWDRMRTTHITLGSPRAECLFYGDEQEAIADGVASSLCYLSLPVGSDEMTLEVSSGSGDDAEALFEDGLITMPDQDY